MDVVLDFLILHSSFLILNLLLGRFMQNPKSILITGSSSGIGKELAKQYAAPGITLFLTGRNSERLEQLAETCRQKGAQVTTAIIEIEDAKTMRTWIEECDKKTPLDLVIANAGISNAGQKASEELERKIYAVNLMGVLNTVYPAIDVMRKRKTGQIAIVSSLASMHGFAYAPAYCSSKAAVKVYGEALRNGLKKDGIQVNVVCPGFIKTPLTDPNPLPMPFIMGVEKAAAIIIKRLAKNQGLIAFPKRLYGLLWTMRLLPAAWIERITGLI